MLGITDVRNLGIPEGSISSDFVKGVVADLIANTKGKVAFRTHSPYDSYLGLTCGHPDHCAVGTALVQLWQQGEVQDLKLYREGQFFGSPKVGDCQPLTRNQLAAKQLMKQEYSKVDRRQGRYGIAGQSVPGAWTQAMTQPECSEFPR